jgi:hypothetical protein
MSLPASSVTQLGFKGLVTGVLYSLRQAREFGFVSRVGQAVGPDYPTELESSLAAMAGRVSAPPAWVAGYYFNSALLRIAAGSHRALRTLFNTDAGWFAELADRAIREGKLQAGDINSLRDVYHDVNAFKHDGHAELLLHRRIETLDQGIAAAGQLISLVRKAV